MSTAKTTALIALIAMGASATLASQVEARRGPGQTLNFEQLDSDGDGKLSLEELQARGEARFDETDTDGSGTLTAEEIAAMILKRATETAADRAARMIERNDDNGDGVLSQEEMSPGKRAERRLRRMFERFDADEDGFITQAEFDEAMEHRGKRRGHREHSE